MPLDPRFRFDTLVVGAANRLAVAAARAVVESPGTVYNPLFVYGGPGLGKTHLLGAIALGIEEQHPGLAIAYLPMDQLIEELHEAIAENGTDEWHARLQKLHLLLLDDVQFLTGRTETQSEVLRLLNALQGAGRQIVMASDRPPADIADVDERLVSRLAGGLTVDMAAPDYETRIAIIRGYCEERDAQFAPGVVEELAHVGFTNVRELQGAFHRLLAHQSLGEVVDASRVRTLLGAPPAPHRAAAPTENEFASFLSEVATVVAEHVDGWRSRVGEAIEQWAAAGYRTAQLEALLASSSEPPEWEAVLQRFTEQVERLRELEERAMIVDAELAGADVLRDPDRLTEAEQLVDRLTAGVTPPSGPSPLLSRGHFVVGPGNRLAVNAADDVIASPGARYNPLFIHGGRRTGKSHLAHAIGNALLAASGGTARVGVVSGQHFAEELITALQEGTVTRWRARYRMVDALIVDDVHAVSGTERTQDELFHAFNALAGEGKQLVFVADRPPQALEGLEERLRSRFAGGLVVEMGSVPRPAPSMTPRISMPAIAQGPDGFFLDPEKVVWVWPDIGARIIEEVR